MEPRGVADDVDFVDARVLPLAVRLVVVVVREAPAVVDGLGMRELAVLDATVDFAGLAREVVVFGVGTRLVVVVVRLVVVFVVVGVPEASGLPSLLCTDVCVFLTFEVVVVGLLVLGEARPSLLPAFFNSPALPPLRLEPDFLRGPKAGGARPSLRSAPDPSRDIPGRFVRNVPRVCPDISGEGPKLRISKFVRPSAKDEKKD